MIDWLANWVSEWWTCSFILICLFINCLLLHKDWLDQIGTVNYSHFVYYLENVVCLCYSELIEGVVLIDENNEPVTQSRVRLFLFVFFLNICCCCCYVCCWWWWWWCVFSSLSFSLDGCYFWWCLFILFYLEWSDYCLFVYFCVVFTVLDVTLFISALFLLCWT